MAEVGAGGPSALERLVARHTAPESPESALKTIDYRLVCFDEESGEVQCGFTATPAMGNLIGRVQGGFVAAMLDATISSALLALLDEDQTAPTLELKVSYLESVPLGSLTAHGRVLRRGRSVAFLAGELYDATGVQLLATASATVTIATLR